MFLKLRRLSPSRKLFHITFSFFNSLKFLVIILRLNKWNLRKFVTVYFVKGGGGGNEGYTILDSLKIKQCSSIFRYCAGDNATSTTKISPGLLFLYNPEEQSPLRCMPSRSKGFLTHTELDRPGRFVLPNSQQQSTLAHMHTDWPTFATHS